MNARLAAFGFASAFMVSALPAQAEVLKFMRMCPGQKLCPFYELVIKPPRDWIEDKEASKQNGVQIMLPRGRTFGNAPALMYVKISSRQGDQSAEDFVRVSQERWRKSVPDTKIEKIADVARANGQSAFLSYRYENPSMPQQRFEAVSFGLDKDKDGNDFFVMVTITGRDKKAIDQAMARYNEFLKTH
jgi:hypothetical protein